MVFEILETGRKNAKTGAELCERLQITKRELGRAIETERRAGRPICSTSDSTKPGYFIAENRDEMRLFCNSLMKRAGEIQKTRRACADTIERLPEGGRTHEQQQEPSGKR